MLKELMELKPGDVDSKMMAQCYAEDLLKLYPDGEAGEALLGLKRLGRHESWSVFERAIWRVYCEIGVAKADRVF